MKLKKKIQQKRQQFRREFDMMNFMVFISSLIGTSLLFIGGGLLMIKAIISFI